MNIHWVGTTPSQDAIVANGGLGWDPRSKKWFIILVVTGNLGGGHTQFIHLNTAICTIRVTLQCQITHTEKHVAFHHPFWLTITMKIVTFFCGLVHLPFPPLTYSPLRNQGLIAGLIKGNQWLYHLESRWRNSHVLVYHGPLLFATFWEWLAIIRWCNKP